MGKALKWTALTVALVATGCVGEFHPGWEEPLEPVGPAMMQEAMIYLDRSFEEIIVVRPELAADETAQLQVERHPTGLEPSMMKASADGQQLYVLNERDSSMSIFAVGAEEVERVDVVLDSSYDQMTVDPHGEFVLLSNSGERRPGTVIQNLNEVGVVDLRGEEPQARFMSLASRAQNLIFMPPFESNGQIQRLAVALADSEITLVDLNAEIEHDQQRRIPLTISQADAVRRPSQVVFDVNNNPEGPERVSLFVLNDLDNDITEIVVQPAIREDQHTKFDISVNQLAAGQRPGRITMLDLERGRRLLALDRQQPRFTLVDIASGESATYNLRMPVPATHLLVYTAQIQGTNDLEKRVLVYAQNSNIVSVIRPEEIALGTETHSGGQALREIRLPRSKTPSRIVMDEENHGNRAVVLHSGTNDGYTVLNLNNHAAYDVEGAPLAEVRFDGSDAFGRFANSPHLVRINLNDGHFQVTRLPARARALHLSPDRSSILVRHDGLSGRFTVLPVMEPTPERARFFEHVFLQGVLDRPAFIED